MMKTCSARRSASWTPQERGRALTRDVEIGQAGEVSKEGITATGVVRAPSQSP